MPDADGGIPSRSQRHAYCVVTRWTSYPCCSGSWSTCTSINAEIGTAVDETATQPGEDVICRETTPL